MTIEEYFGDWMKVIDKAELLEVLKKLREMSPTLLCPRTKNIFRAFELCPYNECKVIMLGMDPYPQKDIATGILFGNRKDTPEDRLSPSLEILKECVINYEIPHNIVNFDVTLESWAKQGILMLNSALTCELNKTGSHVNLWRPFIAKLLRNLSNRESGLIFVLFGSQAQTFRPYINKRYNSIVEAKHPAYYARNNTTMPSAVFKSINRELKERYNTTIEWYKEV